MAIKDRFPHVPTDEVAEHTTANARRSGILAIGDVIVFLVFAAIGLTSHKEAVTPVKVLVTAAPFALGWFLVSPVVGAFKRKETETTGKMATRTALSWAGAWPVGLFFRGLIERAVPPFSFMLVTLITNMLFLLIWRVLFMLVGGLRRR